MASTNTTTRESRLPKWARIELERLRANVEHYNDEAAMLFGHAESRVRVRRSLEYPDHDVFIPEKQPVTFTLTDDTQLSVRLDGDHVVVMAEGTISGRLDVEPRSANVIYVRVRSWNADHFRVRSWNADH